MKSKPKNILLIVLTFSSCIKMTDPKSQAEYIHYRSLFDSSLVNHIPNKIPNNMINMGLASLENLSDNDLYAGMYITTRVEAFKKYNEIKEKYRKKAVYIKKTDDSSLLVIQTDQDMEIKEYNFEKNTIVLPIPQYAVCDYQNSTDTCTLNKSESVFILSYGFKDILKRGENIRRSELPDKFSRGYSTGITINDDKLTIKYWLIIW